MTRARRASRCASGQSAAAAAGRAPLAALARRSNARARVGARPGHAPWVPERARAAAGEPAPRRRQWPTRALTRSPAARQAPTDIEGQLAELQRKYRILEARGRSCPTPDWTLTRVARCTEQPQGVLRGRADGDPPSACCHRESERGQPRTETRARDDCQQGVCALAAAVCVACVADLPAQEDSGPPNLLTQQEIVRLRESAMVFTHKARSACAVRRVAKTETDARPSD